MDTKKRSRVAVDDLALLERMGKTAMTVNKLTKKRSRVAVDDLALLERMGKTAITMKATLGQRVAAAWPATRGTDPNGTWTTQWYLREPERDLVCTYLANVLLPFHTARSAFLHHVCNSTYWSETNKLSSYSRRSKRFFSDTQLSVTTTVPSHL